MHKISVEFEFRLIRPLTTELAAFEHLKNFMCSTIGVWERLHKVLGQIDLGTLDSGEGWLPFGLLVYVIFGNAT